MSAIPHMRCGLRLVPLPSGARAVGHPLTGELVEVAAGTVLAFDALGWGVLQLPDGLHRPLKELLRKAVFEMPDGSKYIGERPGIAETLNCMCVQFHPFGVHAGDVLSKQVCVYVADCQEHHCIPDYALLCVFSLSSGL